MDFLDLFLGHGTLEFEILLEGLELEGEMIQNSDDALKKGIRF